MRTLEEIRQEIKEAQSSAGGQPDADRLEALAAEIEEVDSDEARSIAGVVRGDLDALKFRFDDAIKEYQRALDLVRTVGDRDREINILTTIGVLHSRRGTPQDALPWIHKAITLADDLGQVAVKTSIYANLGTIYLALGEFPDAVSNLRRAQDGFQEQGAERNAATMVLNIGTAYEQTGNLVEGLDLLEEAHDRFAALEDHWGMALTAGNIGIAHSKMGAFDASLEWLQKALVLHERSGNRAKIGQNAISMGNTYARMKDDDTAIVWYQRAADIARETGDDASLTYALSNLGQSLVRVGRLEDARKIVAELDDIGTVEMIPTISLLTLRAALKDHDGDAAAAKAMLLEALEAARTSSMRSQEADIRESLRDQALRQNDLQGYVEHNNEYARITEELKGAEARVAVAMRAQERALRSEREERRREQTVLYSTLPKAIADRVIRGETVEDHFAHACVLFADIASFTTNSSTMDPSAVIQLLENVYKRFDAICAKHRVTKVKTIGDSYLCFAHSENGDRKSESDQEQAASAADRIAAVALAMQQEEFYWPTLNSNSNSNSEQPTATDNGNSIQFRIGIHLGPVSAGVIGTQRLQYDIWGDTVNVASRMESTGEPGRIQVSSAFASALDIGERISDIGHHSSDSRYPISDIRSPKLTKRGSVEVKGKGTMTTYWLEGA